jgi:endonuclease/exonuclease/phosphatase family metal-dependent hydrolase
MAYPAEAATLEAPLHTRLLIVALLLAASPAAGDEFTVLSYNTHGLHSWVAGDDPATRFPIIGERSNAYDVALIQEDFSHHDALRRGARQPIVERGNPSRFGRWCPICSGSGLTILSRFGREDLVELAARAYRDCAGWIGRANDCLATKGFQRMRIRLPGGGELDFVNTHLDAGRSPADREARRSQLDLLRSSIEAEVAAGALILAGDLNLDAADPEDVALRDAFTSALELSNSGARGTRRWPILDYVFYRSGGGVELEVLEAGEDADFVHGSAPLSDHPAIFARFRTRPRVVMAPASTTTGSPQAER